MTGKFERAGLIALAAKLVYELAFGRELEYSVIECCERVDIPKPVCAHMHFKL